MNKCQYCGRLTSKEYCSPRCEQSYYAYLTRVEDWGIYYILGVVASIIILLLPIYFGYYTMFLGIGLLSLGVTVSFMPFPPSFIVRLFGVRRSVKAFRFLGNATALAGGMVMVLAIVL